MGPRKQPKGIPFLAALRLVPDGRETLLHRAPGDLAPVVGGVFQQPAFAAVLLDELLYSQVDVEWEADAGPDRVLDP